MEDGNACTILLAQAGGVIVSVASIFRQIGGIENIFDLRQHSHSYTGVVADSPAGFRSFGMDA
jgi:hypothetical protein